MGRVTVKYAQAAAIVEKLKAQPPKPETERTLGLLDFVATFSDVLKEKLAQRWSAADVIAFFRAEGLSWSETEFRRAIRSLSPKARTARAKGGRRAQNGIAGSQSRAARAPRTPPAPPVPAAGAKPGGNGAPPSAPTLNGRPGAASSRPHSRTRSGGDQV